MVGKFHYLKITHMGHPNGQPDWTPPELEKPVIKPVTVTMGVDPAAGLSRSAARSWIQPLATTAEDDWFLLPYWCDRVRPGALVYRVQNMNSRFKPIWIRIEDVAFQETIADDAKRHLKGVSIRTEKRPYPLRMEMHFDSKKVFMPWLGTDLLRYELSTFPLGKTNDGVMALYFAQHRRYPPTHEYMGNEPQPEHAPVGGYEDWMVV